jgi:hypothetical protein
MILLAHGVELRPRPSIPRQSVTMSGRDDAPKEQSLEPTQRRPRRARAAPPSRFLDSEIVATPSREFGARIVEGES